MAEQSKIDWKGIGYLFSIAGVLLLGARSLPRPNDPSWFWWALIGGIIIGLASTVLAVAIKEPARR